MLKTEGLTGPHLEASKAMFVNEWVKQWKQKFAAG